MEPVPVLALATGCAIVLVLLGMGIALLVGIRVGSRPPRVLTRRPAPGDDAAQKESAPPELLWLGDAPLFIDETRVEAFYDAILRPETELVQTTVGQSLTSSLKTVGEVGVEAAVPGLTKFAASASQEYGTEQGRSMEATMKPVSNPSRHLYALALHYRVSPDLQPRLLLGGPDALRDGTGAAVPLWHESAFTATSPRALAILDLPPGAPLMPMAFERSDGRVVPVYQELGKRLGKRARKKPPEYPGTGAARAERNEYFKWFADNFSSGIAMETLEEEVGEARIEWLDLRVPFGSDPVVYLHLSLAPSGKYPTGVFGYQFVRRATKHGVRIVGTLKSEPDINVLALFER